MMKNDGLARISTDKILEKYGNTKIIVFGAGFDGIRFYKKLFNKLNISYYVDNGKTDERMLGDKPLYSYSYLRENYNDEIIIIASMKYCLEISEQLEEDKFEQEKDFWIWDGCEEGHRVDFCDNKVIKYKNLNKKLWKTLEGKRIKENKILIPYRNTCEIVYPAWSYAANYLADKYNASIYCIGGIRDIFNSNVYDIYKSFNVVGFVDETPKEKLKEEAYQIFQDIWEKIKTVDDIKKIVVYGENFGIDILRDYLRFNFPTINELEFSLKKQIEQMIEYIVFWHHYFIENCETVKAVIVWDGIYYREGIIRKIAYGYGIPVYTVDNRECFRWDYEVRYNFEYYKKFYNMLSAEEQRKGIYWAKAELEKHITGYVEKFDMGSRSVFSEKITDSKILSSDNRLKVMICPHYSEDDAFPYGEDMLFDTPWEWLEYLGNMSNKLSYDWYLKPHPIEKQFGDDLIDIFLKKYPKIKLLPKFVSPVQLRKEGMAYALTIHGSIGYEYPYIGINVVNAGYNPHISFNFSRNPKSIAEYEKILTNLNKLETKIDKNEIYQFYCIHFGFYKSKKIDLRKFLYKSEYLKDIRGLIDSKTESTTELFNIYTDEITEERHEYLKKKFEQIFIEMDGYKDGIFYKNELSDE